MLQRMKEAELFKEWESQEDQVCLISSNLFSDLWTFPHYLYVICVQWRELKFFICNYGLVLQFHLEQAQLRSKIRIESGRGMCTLCL